MRSANENTLPPLAATCVGFKGFADGEQRADRVEEILASVIEDYRREVSQRFYALREVATFFGVSVNTAQRVYRRLERKGVLTRVRGFETRITARTAQSRFAVRGVVAMPIWLPGFLKFQDWRKFFFQLEEELSRHRFVLEPVFYRNGEEMNSEFISRVLRFSPDCVFWSCPSPMNASIMHGIADTGVPMVVVQNTPGQFPGRIYHLSYIDALQQGVNEWQASGKIDALVIPQSGTYGIANVSATMMIHSGIRTSLPYRFEVFPSDSFAVADYVKRLAPNPRTGIIFDDDLFYIRLCRVMPEMMLDLFHRHRVMVMRQIEIPSQHPLPDPKVDALLFPAKLAAKRIATDISKNKAGVISEQLIIEAEWHPRIPLAEVAQIDFSE